MRPVTRAWLALGLGALLAAAVLHLLVLLGVGRAWGAMVHLALFGWITALIVAVSSHTAPVFTGRDFARRWPGWAQLATWAVGLVLASGGLLLRLAPLEMAGLLLELVAALIFVANVALLPWLGRPRAVAPPPAPIAGLAVSDQAASLATRLAACCLPAALGLLLAARLGLPGREWALAAEHLATLGWVMLTIVGVAFRTLPRFSARSLRSPRAAWAQLACHVTAVALIVPALGLGLAALVAVGGLLMTVAAALLAWTIWPTLHVVAPMPAGHIPLVPTER